MITDDDIVRARLRTVGIQEHRIHFKQGTWENPKCEFPASFGYPTRHPKHIASGGPTSNWEWRIFDVGGCRTKVRKCVSSLCDYLPHPMIPDHSAVHGFHTLIMSTSLFSVSLAVI